MASGSPSSRAQISPTAATFASLSVKSGRTACARATNSWIAADSWASASDGVWPVAGADRSGATGYSCSPMIRSGVRLVASTVSRGQAPSSMAISGAAGDDVLDVIEHEQHVSSRATTGAAGRRWIAALRRRRRAPGRSSGAPWRARAAERGARYQTPCGIRIGQFSGDLQRQAGFANAARSGQRDQRNIIARQQRADRVNLRLPANE